MVNIKLSISHPDGTAQSMEVEGSRAQQFLSKRMGEILDGSILGLQDLKLQITGGSDKDGFPMRRDVHGGVRKAIMINVGTGFRTRVKGKRRRKMIRGNIITDDIVQVNLKVLKNTE